MLQLVVVGMLFLAAGAGGWLVAGGPVQGQAQAPLTVGEQEVTAGEYAVEGEAPRLVVARTTMGGDTVFAVGLYSAENPDSRDSVEALFGELARG